MMHKIHEESEEKNSLTDRDIAYMSANPFQVKFSYARDGT
jgi:hypothetical protein